MQAGMSGFLAKPLVPDELKRVISSFCKGELIVTEKENASSPEKLEALRIRHINEMRTFFEWLAEAPNDPEAIADNAHRIAGTAAAFGQPELAKALVALEEAAGRGDDDGIARATATARRAWQEAPAPDLV